MRTFLIVLLVGFTQLSVSSNAGDIHDDVIEPTRDSSTRKFAVRGSHIYQEANYRVASLDLAFPGLAQGGANISPDLLALVPLLGPDAIKGIEDSYHVSSAYLDWTPFEWIQFSGRLGTVEGEADVNLIQPFDPVTFQYDGYVYGF